MAEEKKYLKIIMALLKSPKHELYETEVKDLLGSASRATWYRQKKKLISGESAILKEIENPNYNKDLIDAGPVQRSKYLYHLKGSFDDLAGLSKEETFVMEAYKHLGSLLDANITDIPFYSDEEVTSKDLSELSRKFFYLSKITARPFKEQNQEAFRIFINALLNNKYISIYYPSKNDPEAQNKRKVQPLTLCHYRDDLYILAKEEKEVDGSIEWVTRNYIISRIVKIEETNEPAYKYPIPSKWNPVKDYSRTSGLIISEERIASIRVHGPMRLVLTEKYFMNSKLIESHEEYDVYEFIYTSESEFLGQIFTWANSLEILSPLDLREAFIEKAQAAIDRNQTIKKAA